MSSQDFITLLQESSIWSEPKTSKRDDYITEAGGFFQDVIFVEEGTLHFFLLDDGLEQSIRFAYPGNVVSALDSYITGKPTKYYLQTLRKVVYRTCSKLDFENYLKEQKH